MNKDLEPKGLDKDLDRVAFVSDAAEAMGRRLSAPGLAVIFLVICAVIASLQSVPNDMTSGLILVSAAIIGGYMALNIGANDVANNVGPAVGARVVSLPVALIIAAICESAGALLAGSDVVSTISADILAPNDVPDNFVFMKAMLSALAAAALWINFATLVGAPVSTTHTIIGGVVGAGIAASGAAAIDWGTIGTIASTWVLSPLMGGAIAACTMAFINAHVIYVEDKLAAALRWLPVLIGALAATFTIYLILKGLDRILQLPFWVAIPLPALVGGGVWLMYRRVVAGQALVLDNKTQSLRSLFAIPLMCSAALMSFAHGANDVANVIGPLAAIVQSSSDELSDLHFWFMGTLNPEIPLWVSAVGAFGISAGLLLFGRRLVTVVGKRITKLNPIRAFCATLATSATVLAASSLGLPVSSTHIAVGAIFGVGLFREWYRNQFVADNGKLKNRKLLRNKEERRRRLLVRRSNLFTIVGAWIVTVPVSGVLAAGLFHLLNFFVIPN